MNSLTLYRKTSSGWPPTSYKYYNNLQEIQQMSSINIQIPKLIEPFKAFPRTSWEFPFLCLCFTIIWFLFCLCNTLVLMCFLTLTIREISTPASVPFFQMVSWQFQVFVLYYSFSVVFFFFLLLSYNMKMWSDTEFYPPFRQQTKHQQKIQSRSL